MRIASLAISILVLAFGACDVDKSVGDDPKVAQDSSTSTDGSSDATLSGSGQSPSSSGSGAAPNDGNVECPPFDPGPASGSEYYEVECVCEDCTLRYEDLPAETVQQFFSDFENGLCACLCQQEGCGPLQGGGGAVGDPGFETEGDATTHTGETTGGDGTGGTDSTGSTSG